MTNTASGAQLPGRDEVTLKVAWDRLRSTANEAATTLYRTGFSPYLRDLVDVGSAICDPRGRMLAASDIGSPGHMNPLSEVSAGVLRVYPDMEPGDVFVLNDPWISSGHLLDMAVVTPVFHNERLAALVCCIYHSTDVGGIGFTSYGNDIYEEGLFLPPMRLMRAGVMDEHLLRLILANVRRSGYFAGDLEAAMTSNRIGAQGIERILVDLSLDDLEWIGAQILDRSRTAMRSAIRELKEGNYHSSVDLDPLDEGGDPIHIEVAVTVRGGEIVMDYAGTGPQVRRGINSTLVYSAGYSKYAARLAVTDSLPNNSGTLEPLVVVAPEGSIVAARHPAPTACRHSVGQNLPTLILLALADAQPPHAISDSPGASVGVHFIPDEGVVLSGRLSTPGGTGARRHADGLIATSFPSRIYRQPIEFSEEEGFVRYLRQERRRGSGGEGLHRGGDGMLVEVEFIRCGGMLDVTSERAYAPPQGVGGAGPGLGPRVLLNGKLMPPRWRQHVDVGDRLLIESAGGGGWS